MRRRPAPRLLLLAALAAAAAAGGGCHHEKKENPDVGLIPAGQYDNAAYQNQQRLAGEDRRKVSPITNPFKYIGHGLNVTFVQPVKRGIDYLQHNTPGTAARQMVDVNSPDNRRAGTLKLSSYAFMRNGDSLIVYNRQTSDADYTVRAAGIRALNRCRAKGYTGTFLKGLADDQPLVRLEAAKALANIPDDAAVPALLSHLQADNNKDVRIACADALRNYRTIEVAHALIDVLNDEDFSVAWQARQSLMLITKHDYRYDTRAWLDFLSRENPFGG